MQSGWGAGLLERDLPANKSQEMWGRLRKGYRGVVIQMRRTDLQPSVLVHGVQLLRRVAVPVPLLCAAHLSEERSLVSVDCAGTLQLYYEDGRLRGTRQLSGPVSGLLYAEQVQQYVAWNQRELLLFDRSFMCLSRVPIQQGVSSCVYHPGKNLVLSSGFGGVIVWGFGHSSRSLVRQQYLSQGMTDEDKVTALTIDSKSPHLPTLCYAACGSSVWEYELCTGTLRRVRRHLHARAISSLLYSEQLHLLISGSRDGSIKVWDSAAQLTAVYVAHTGPVTALSLTSSGTVLVSGSEDASLRTWDLSTQEPMDEQRVSGALLGLDAFCSNENYIVSYSSHELHVWHVQHLYQLHCLLGATVTEISVSEELIPSRALCVCADATVRLISASTGELIATLDGAERLLAAEYCALQKTVCALLGDGHLLKASALTSPMRVVSKVKVGRSHSLPCCFSLFSCRADKKAAGKPKHHEGLQGKEHVVNRKNHRFFCIIGLDDGCLQVYNWYSDQLQCEIEAHSPGQVTGLMCDPENQYIISAGSDLMVKVWRFYPYSEESLSLYMSFFCAQRVVRVCSLSSQLFVGFHDSSSATYTIVQYCLQTGTRSDHPSSQDHQDQITGLCASPGLGLVASCGRDRTLRIWTEENRLLRLLHLNASPESLSFCGGELLLGIHGHIYRISLMKFLSQPYKLKIMCMTSPPTSPHRPNPADHTEDKTRTAPPHRDSVEKTGQREEVREGCDTGRLRPDTMSQECFLLSSRDRELHLLQMGELRAQKMTKGNKETKKEAMKKYLHLIYKEKPGVTIPEHDDFDPQDVLTTPKDPEPKKIPFLPLEKNRGFFTDLALGFTIDSLPEHLQTSFSTAGVVPNSALLQLLWPMKRGENLRPIRRDELPPEDKQLVEPSNIIPEMENMKKSKETEETTEETAEETAGETTEETNDVDEIPSILQDILATLNTRKVSPPVPETSSLPPQPPPAQSHKPARPTRPQITRLSRIPRPHPFQTKNFQESAIPVQLPPLPPPPSQAADTGDKPCASSSSTFQEDDLPVRIPEISAVPEIPLFILQFQDQSWFSLVLPEAEAQYSEFESRLLSAILPAGQPMGTQLLHALQTLHQQGHLKDPQHVFQTLKDAINSRADLTVCEEQEFVYLCLRLMNDLSRESGEVIVELLVTCVQIQAPCREMFIALFHEFGVHDPHGFIAKKCSSWDTWDETGNSRRALRRICGDWLHQWTARLRDHLHAVTAWNKEPSHGGRTGRNRRSKEIREHVLYDGSPIHVLNYYCDVQMNKELLGLKDCGPGHGSAVLALPPIDRGRALLRLGETGMHGRQRDQAGGNFPTVRPLLRSDIIPYINLPVKKVTLNPFISTEDAPMRAHVTDIQRYFIVNQSYIERY